MAVVCGPAARTWGLHSPAPGGPVALAARAGGQAVAQVAQVAQAARVVVREVAQAGGQVAAQVAQAGGREAAREDGLATGTMGAAMAAAARARHRPPSVR